MVNSLSVATFFHGLLPIEKTSENVPSESCAKFPHLFMQHCCNAVEILFLLNDAILKLFIVLKNMISPMRYSHFLFYWKLLGWKGIFIVYKCTSVTPHSKVHKLMLLDCPRFKQTFITCYKFLFTCLIFREYKPAGYNF